MSPLEASECIHQLASLFPESGLTDAEIELFREELAKFDRESILEGIRAHRLFCRYNRPQFPSIFAEARDRMRGKRPQQQSLYRTVIAQGIASANPKLNGRPEAELILRYHRHWLTWASRNLKTGAIERHALDDPKVIARVHVLKGQCVTDLIAAGWERKFAEQATDWLDAIDPDFESALCQVDNSAAEREACPV